MRSSPSGFLVRRWRQFGARVRPYPTCVARAPAGALYVFRSRRADRVKIVWWDGTGVCLFAKRLDEHGFHWPRIENSVIHLSTAQLMALIDGMDWTRVKAVEARHPMSVG